MSDRVWAYVWWTLFVLALVASFGTSLWSLWRGFAILVLAMGAFARGTYLYWRDSS